ncbi:M16 family metallopeptidase [Sphingomonas hankyongi]|uniref:Insulinase family protein n=1 Tax=Sphingomonas hankyongi TaxID=2908209 RepID=A0ABT0S063_9SPHN|nr:pitrilysin family protein [Sphingomonas hankyongi]MCL6729243.1 insulinase family protein [Sphingomonas hankyongi]
MRVLSRLALLTAAAVLTCPPLAAAPIAKSVPIPTLVKQITIPHSTFRLANGLTFIVHEDHKTPIVAVSTWYNVGSKDEPKGKTGFAHLFEHLMFNGTENLPGDYFEYLQQIGATDYNGTTSYDRTNYFETVPKGALERTLFMESDRMGYLLGAVTQGVLDNQRSVVQNEKRQGDSQPGGLVQYEMFGRLFPDGHPYHHTTIGSMADLDAASLEDVKQWFRDRYGPNNAVLVIAGDVTAAEAKPLVEKYFGSIGRGPVNRPAMATVPTLAKPQSIEMKDNVAATTIQRFWAVPGLLDKRLAALDIGGSVLGGLASSRLDKLLVREEKIAVGVTADLIPLQRAGIFTMTATVKPGVDPALVSKRLDEVLADYLAKGPTEDEVQRAIMGEVGGRIRGLEQVGGFGGKAVTLAEGQTYANDSDYYKKTLAAYAGITPAIVRAAMRQWISRPPLTITLVPGERDADYAETKAAAAAKSESAAPAAKPTRQVPPLGQLSALDFPAIEHTQLANGIPVEFVQRTGVPVTQLALQFDAGDAADPVSARGLAGMTMGLMDEGTTSLSSQEIAEAEERLGANVSSSNSADRSYVMLNTLSPNLAASLDLFTDVVLNPAFEPAEIERVKAQALTGIAQLQKDPTRVANRVLPGVLFGASHPYGGPSGGDPKAIAAFTRADLANFQQRWLRPDNAKFFVVSNLPLSEVKPMLETRLGHWAAPAAAKGTKTFTAPPPRPTAQKILLVNRPGAPQSSIVGAQLLPIDPKGDIIPLHSANDTLGGGFLSRLNLDLREDKGWSYGVGGGERLLENSASYVISAPVQADRTGDALAELNKQVQDFLSTKGVTQDELTRTVARSINELPGEFETAGAVISALMRMDLLGRPDNYYETLPGKYRALTTASADQAIRRAVDPNGFTWIVVGDAAKVRPQLEKLGMPIETVEAP